MQTKKSLAVLISGHGSNLQSIIDYSKHNTNCSYKVDLIISNKCNAYGLERAKMVNIPNVCIDHTKYKEREFFDQKIIEVITEHKIHFIALAGFMRVLSPMFIKCYEGKIINIHPSLLPKYPGLNTHQRALESQDKKHGISIHFVTSKLDSGPVIFQAETNINAKENVDSLKQKIHKLEHVSYPKIINDTVNKVFELKKGKTYFNGTQLKHPITPDSS